MIKKVLPILALSFMLYSQSWAGGLSMRNYAEIMVENLQVGQEYSMMEIVNLPLEIVNKSDKSIIIEINVYKPGGKKIKKGFEAIPESSWIMIEPKQADIPANGVYSTDVKIKIPDDEKLLGKKFHADIHVRTVSKGKSMLMVALAVQGRLLFTVAPIRKAGKNVKKVNLNFSSVPARVDMKDVPTGKKVEVLTSDKKQILIKNSSDVKTTMFLQSLDPQKTILTIEPGYEACPQPDFISFKKDEFKVNGKSEKNIKVFIEIPDEAQYKGKKYQFIIAVSTGQKTSGIRYIPVMVTTEE